MFEHKHSMNTRNPNSGLNEARQLEDLKFGELMCEYSTKANVDIKFMEQELAARNMLRSGERFKRMADIILKSAEDVIDKAIAYRRDLGATVPALLEANSIKTLGDKLDRYVDGSVNGIRQRATMLPRGTGSASVNQETQQKAYSIKARLNRKLAALPLEAKLALLKEEPKVATLNISNSTIANLNLGNVMGDLNSSIQNLNAMGRNEVAEGLKGMTEAIASSQDLGDDARKDALEHLAIVSTEAAMPPEMRKMGPLKTSIAAIKSSIGVTAQLVSIWQGLEHILKSNGIIH
jgi:hypothetical protein